MAKRNMLICGAIIAFVALLFAVGNWAVEQAVTVEEPVYIPRRPVGRRGKPPAPEPPKAVPLPRGEGWEVCTVWHHPSHSDTGDMRIFVSPAPDSLQARILAEAAARKLGLRIYIAFLFTNREHARETARQISAQAETSWIANVRRTGDGKLEYQPFDD